MENEWNRETKTEKKKKKKRKKESTMDYYSWWLDAKLASNKSEH